MDIAVSADTTHHPWVLRKVACAALRRYGSQEVIERLMKELSFELAGGNPLDPKNRMRGKGTGLATDNPLGVQDVLPAYGVPDTDLYPVLSATKEITGKSFDANEKRHEDLDRLVESRRPEFCVQRLNSVPQASRLQTVESRRRVLRVLEIVS